MDESSIDSWRGRCLAGLIENDYFRPEDSNDALPVIKPGNK